MIRRAGEHHDINGWYSQYRDALEMKRCERKRWKHMFLRELRDQRRVERKEQERLLALSEGL